ncbi:MAG: endonuclease/exonuclease/phosphatase family protein [Polyangiaceae bacterium]
MTHSSSRVRKEAPSRQKSRLSAGAAICAVAAAYPVSLLLGVCAFRFVGERWWVTGVGLYVPRLVFGLPLPFLVLALLAARRASLLWTQGVAALVLVVALMGFSVPFPTYATARTPTMRVLSYNVESGHGVGDYDDVLAEVARYSPDVVFLQEVGPTEKLAPLLKDRYADVYAANQFVVASRYPIVSTSLPDPVLVHGRPHTPRFMRLEIDCPLGHIVFYDVHPVSPREALWRVVWGGRRGLLTGQSFNTVNSGAFYENSALREEQAATFAAAAARETEPVIIAGDTNLPDLSWVFGHYLSQFQDGFLKAGWGFGYTFPTDRHGPWMRIDRILASRALRFAHFEVGTSNASDHRCVVADIQRAGL